jgi:hypothetical protein
MYEGRTVLAQLIDHLPRHSFRRLVRRYRGDHRTRSFTCWDQFLSMTFAQLTYRESLRDIEACLGAVPARLYHLGFRTQAISRSTLADANEKRDWRIYADFAQSLIQEARRLYTGDSFGLDLDQTVYALDSSTIDLCLALFPWARFRRAKGAIKLHTLLDLTGSIPTFIRITAANVNDVRILDELLLEAGSIYVMDRGYTDFARLYRLHQAQAFFVIRAKRSLDFQRRYSRPVDRSTGLICDQTIVLQGPKSSKRYPVALRRIRVRDLETGKRITLLTNNFNLPAKTVADLYIQKWGRFTISRERQRGSICGNLRKTDATNPTCRRTRPERVNQLQAFPGSHPDINGACRRPRTAPSNADGSRFLHQVLIRSL